MCLISSVRLLTKKRHFDNLHYVTLPMLASILFPIDTSMRAAWCRLYTRGCEMFRGFREGGAPAFLCMGVGVGVGAGFHDQHTVRGLPLTNFASPITPISTFTPQKFFNFSK